MRSVVAGAVWGALRAIGYHPWMRGYVDAGTVEGLMQASGRRVRGPGRVYLTEDATALLEGWRVSTLDTDLELDPEPLGIFEAIARVKEELEASVELASPDPFLLPLPGWRERSEFIVRHGLVDSLFFHDDFRAQARAKLARAHDRDRSDARDARSWSGHESRAARDLGRDSPGLDSLSGARRRGIRGSGSCVPRSAE